MLANGEHLAADLVLYCTGYKKTYSYFDGAVLVSGFTGRLGVERGPASQLTWWLLSLCAQSCLQVTTCCCEFVDAGRLHNWSAAHIITTP